MASVIVHLKEPDARKPDLSGRHLRLYRHLRALCERDGIAFQVRPRDADIRIGTRKITHGRFDDGDLHIIDDRSVQAAGVLNASASYFWDFWHLDPLGTKAFSSIGQRQYNPKEVSYRWAKDFYGTLRDTYVKKRLSKYEQPSERQTLPDGAIAVFFQGDYPRVSGATSLTDFDVLTACLAASGDRPVVVKPHPRATPTRDVDQAIALAAKDPRVTITDANVHDILRHCSVTASINSSVALEGYLHRKPALLFGQSDFHHIAYPVTNPRDTKTALSAALDHQGGFAQYVTWYFKRNCLWLSRKSLDDKIWAAFETAGFPRDRLLRG